MALQSSLVLRGFGANPKLILRGFGPSSMTTVSRPIKVKLSGRIDRVKKSGGVA